MSKALFASRRPDGHHRVQSDGILLLPGRATSVCLYASEPEFRSALKAIECHDASWAGLWQTSERLDEVAVSSEELETAPELTLRSVSELAHRTAHEASASRRRIDETRVLLRPLEKRVWDACSQASDLEHILRVNLERTSHVKELANNADVRIGQIQSTKIELVLMLLTVISLSQTLLAAIVFGFTTAGGDATFGRSKEMLILGLVVVINVMVAMYVFRRVRARESFTDL